MAEPKDDKPKLPLAGLIALLAAGAIAIIWWGRHLHRRWKEARENAARAAQERDAEN